MNDMKEFPVSAFPPGQKAIWKKAVHSSGSAALFDAKEVEGSIARRFTKLAGLFQHHPAVIDRHGELTYEAVEQWANGLANEILEQSGRSEAVVTLVMGNSAPVVASIFGVLKAAKPFVWADTSWPFERLAHQLHDSDSKVIVTDEENLALARRLVHHRSASVINLNKISPTKNRPDHQISNSRTAISHLLYTSGTTGAVKGVIQTHRNVLHTIRVEAALLNLCIDDRLATFASGTGQALMNIFAALLTGATLCIFDTKRHGIVPLTNWLADTRATICRWSALLFRIFTRTLSESGCFPDLRLIRLASETVTDEDVVAYRKYFADSCILINGIAASETGTFRNYFIDKATEINTNTVPVGYEFEGKQVIIIGKNGELLQCGEAGEIAIRSQYISPGYWRRPDLTRQQFFPDEKDDALHIYRTGDRGLLHADGCLEHLGRQDLQVKVRGYRVELAEVERALLKLDRVLNATVMQRDDEQARKRLVAYVVPKADAPLTGAKLRAKLMLSLPDYMVPSTFVLLDALPLTPGGKVDRTALPMAPAMRPALESPFVVPRTETEERLEHIWREVLGIDRVGINDHFLDLGGDSLTAMQIVARITNQMGIAPDLSTLFTAQTVAKMAVLMEHQSRLGEVKENGGQLAGRLRTDSDDTVTPGQGRLEASLPISLTSGVKDDGPRPHTNDGFLKLSFAQERSWLLNQLYPGNGSHNRPRVLRVHGNLNTDLLRRSIDAIIERQQALRTVVRIRDGKPFALILNNRQLHIAVRDLRNLQLRHQQAEAQRLMVLETQRPFDLEKDLMLRCLLLQLTDYEHLILLVMHEFACDRWSMNILIRELGSLYTAYSRGIKPSLAPLPIQYADFARWQREQLGGSGIDEVLDYWKGQLKDVPHHLDLPADLRRPTVPSFAGARQQLSFPSSLYDALVDLSRREGVTLFMTLLAAFQTLLHRLSGQDRIVVGSPIAGRTRVETIHLIGKFATSLALTTDVSGNPSFRKLLQRVRKVTLGAFAHQQVSFEKIVEMLNPVRDLQRSPFFQVMFQLWTAEEPDVKDWSGLRVVAEHFDRKASEFDLTLSLAETDQGLEGHIEYNTDLFDAATIDRMIGHFQTLLEEIAAEPNQQIGMLPILTETERHQLLVEWNDTRTDYPRDKCIHQLFEEQVKRSPDAVAVVFEDEKLTYRELNEQSNQLAHYLIKHGVGPEVLVGICMERSLDMIIGLLGILKAGGAYVPLDPTFPHDRLAFMLKDSKARILLTQECLLKELPPHDGDVVCLDTAWETIENEPKSNPISGALSENLVYVIYTSGSTGKPKGVAMQHHSLTNLLLWQQNNLKLSGSVKTLQLASLSFDVSFQEIFSTLCSGCILVLAPEELRRDSRSLIEYLNENSIERLYLPFVALQQLADVTENHLSLPPSLVEIITAGEQLQITPHIAELFSKLKACTLHNQYGPTESHVVTAFTLMGSPDDWPLLPPIGRPIANTQIYLMDKHLQPVPVGVVGELYIGGTNLARCYLNRPGLTSNKFIPNPFGDEPEERLYKTGDLARYLPDGNIEFLGRIDHQVKIRGYRIELGEIEAVLCQHPAVSESVVVVQGQKADDKRLTVYVVTTSHKNLADSELQAYLRKRLPEYMIPSRVVFLDSIPLTPSGKIDRQGLPAPNRDIRIPADESAGPMTPKEKRIAQIWSELLGVDCVGPTDDFFLLGGHSLLAMRVISRVRDLFGVEISLRVFFEVPTVRRLAGVVLACSSQTDKRGSIQ